VALQAFCLQRRDGGSGSFCFMEHFFVSGIDDDDDDDEG
jgi:hypothetical protein